MNTITFNQITFTSSVSNKEYTLDYTTANTVTLEKYGDELIRQMLIIEDMERNNSDFTAAYARAQKTYLTEAEIGRQFIKFQQDLNNIPGHVLDQCMQYN